MEITHVLALAGGLAALVAGGDLVVRHAARLARSLGIAPLLVGVTIVAVGTSAPELAVSTLAALDGRPDVSVGNVVGSNILNILVVLGSAALVRPLVVAQRLVRWDVPIMIAASVLVLLLGHDGVLGGADGALLLGLLIAYLLLAVTLSRREPDAVAAEYEREFAAPEARDSRRLGSRIAGIAAGLALLTVGGHLAVGGAAAIARALGVGELVISLTVIAGGTSLPELFTVLAAMYRDERDIGVGNAIGSNIMNLLLILGVAALAAPHGLAVAARVRSLDLPVMTAVAVASLPIFFVGRGVSRRDGLLFVSAYLAYTGYVVLDAAASPAAPLVGAILLYGGGPLVAAVLLGPLLRELRRRPT